MKTATLRATQAQVLEEENRRLRRALECIRDTAAAQAHGSLDRDGVSSLAFTLIGRMADDELERAA